MQAGPSLEPNYVSCNRFVWTCTARGGRARRAGVLGVRRQHGRIIIVVHRHRHRRPMLLLTGRRGDAIVVRALCTGHPA